MARDRYTPSGDREVTCRCGVTFTRRLGARGRPRKWCDVCLIGTARKAADRINEKTTERLAEAKPYTPNPTENGYRSICVSVYDEDLTEWHAKVAAMRRLGIPRPSISELLRRAVAAYVVDAAGVEDLETKDEIILGLTAVEREIFLACVTYGAADECWPWTARIDKGGYGLFQLCGRAIRANRIAAFIATEALGLVAMHHCDNPQCVNPRHLSWADNPTNTRDAARKGRLNGRAPNRFPGEDNGYAKLSNADVREIRQFGTSVDRSTLAARFGVCVTTISRARSGPRHWRSVS